jgi:hypothetical protein
MKRTFSTIFIIGLFFLQACANSRSQILPIRPPDSWTAQFEGQDNKCRDLDHEFINEGELNAISENGPSTVYLNELMFSSLPGGLMPYSVSLVTKSNTDKLVVRLLGESTRELQYDVSCESGWHVLVKERSGQYVGDGVTEKRFFQKSYFRIGNKNELIVRVLGQAEFNSMYVFNSSIQLDEWYRFMPNASEQ